ncbi:MAG: hypothetical protein D6751_05880 [Deltaproteobacteria bacterium]|nr:MAG: hypothetical protein D6751_05880 [Deltaproteobacteria bacterium]
MKRKDVRRLCRDVEEGRVREVEHQVTHQHGEVISCDHTTLKVKSGDRLQNWAGENCERS